MLGKHHCHWKYTCNVHINYSHKLTKIHTKYSLGAVNHQFPTIYSCNLKKMF